MAAVERNFDYIRAREQQRIPGYGGHCPLVKSFYGTTYGNATKTSFIISDLQSSNMSTTSSLLRRNSTDPKGVTINYLQRPRLLQRPCSALPYSQWVKPPYTLTHTGKRRDEILTLNEESQRHREHYRDLTGTLHQVPCFTHRRAASAPTTRTTFEIKKKAHFQAKDLPNNLTKVDNSIQYSKLPLKQLKYPKYNMYRQPSARDKATRDIYFERR